MNKKGDLSIEIVISAIIFFLAFYVFLVIYDPIFNDLLAPILDNTEKVTYGPTVKLILLIIPVVIALLGIVLVVRSLNRPPPIQYYQ